MAASEKRRVSCERVLLLHKKRVSFVESSHETVGLPFRIARYTRTGIVVGRSTLRFPLGRIFTSPRVMALLDGQRRAELVRRHASSDGDRTHQADHKAAVGAGRNVCSTFFVRNARGQAATVWVFTEADVGRTLLMCPEESLYRASDLLELQEPIYVGSADPTSSPFATAQQIAADALPDAVVDWLFSQSSADPMPPLTKRAGTRR